MITQLQDHRYCKSPFPVSSFEMGEVAMNLLLQLIESKRPVTDFETKVLSIELLIRGSTKIKKNKGKRNCSIEGLMANKRR